MNPPLITLIKNKHDDKSDKDFVKLKLGRDLTSATSELYEFNIALFDNGNPEEFLLFMKNFNTNIAASGTLATGVKIQYLCTIFRG